LGFDYYSGKLFEVVWGVLRYAFKRVIQVSKACRSRSWQTHIGKVESTELDGERPYGCSTVSIVFTYAIDGSTYGGECERSFFSWSSAVEYATLIKSKEEEVVLRIDPSNPEAAILLKEDQLPRLVVSG
jgi:hypothetical protein